MRDVKAIEADLNTILDDFRVLDFNDFSYEPTLKTVLALTEELRVAKERVEDLNAAKYLLNKHGYAFKIFGPEDVETLLQSAEDNDGAGRDIAKIVSHVVEGDDWQTMADVTDGDEANLYALIEGTQGDHPEWFGTAS
jgi:hypothetical protein